MVGNARESKLGLQTTQWENAAWVVLGYHYREPGVNHL